VLVLELLDDELELDELLEELPLQVEITPPGPNCSSQVSIPIQLWFFSQPQPLLWLSHSAYSPSSNHWHTSAQLPPELLDEELLELELEFDELLEELLEEELEELLEDELELLEDELEELLEEELDEPLDELVPWVHTEPSITGISAAAPGEPLLPCTPKVTDWPGCTVLFQFKAEAE